jgi:hypothetical protein
MWKQINDRNIYKAFDCLRLFSSEQSKHTVTAPYDTRIFNSFGIIEWNETYELYFFTRLDLLQG